MAANGVQSSAGRQLVLGLLFLVALAILLAFTILLNENSIFGSRFAAEASFPEANGLGKGDPVLVHGVRAGRVQSVEYNPQADLGQRVLVRMNLEEWVREALREDAITHIEVATLLGGRQVTIDPGQGAPRAAEEVVRLAGEVRLDVLNQLGETLGEIDTETLDAVFSEALALLQDARTGEGLVGQLISNPEYATEAREMMASIRGAGDGVSGVTDLVMNGDGFLPLLLRERTLYDQAGGIMDDLSETLRLIREGDGSVARLLNDGTFAETLESAATRIDGLIAGVEAGEGNLGLLFKSEDFMRSAQSLIEDVQNGDGLLPALISNAETRDRFDRILEDVEVVTNQLSSGQGTLGRLAMEDELYDQALTALGLLNRSLEDFREAAPISSFTNVILGGF